ncbi:S26 family signal peptidase [Sphingobium sp. SA916]|uniref:S26 family signal peptidase n=1 Tax=Sphingobium sp. SA916 TaxID=1851207 RepID=UPI000C9ECE55|nr:S26 family signal peptidase [Sphingobium sp. SA916]PNQ03984.1 peptidase [Sphingobium sp. SA916]
MLRLFLALIELIRAIGRGCRRLPRQAATALGAPEAGGSPRPEQLWWCLALVLPMALFAAVLIPQLMLVMSPSIEAWIVRKAPGPIERGDYVMFTLRHPIAGPKPILVTKHALCLPGDRLTMIETPSLQAVHATDGRYFCNGALLGVSLPVAHNGMKLEHMHWSGIIPKGMIYVGSPHPRGFDSRYFGLLPTRRLTRIERVL